MGTKSLSEKLFLEDEMSVDFGKFMRSLEKDVPPPKKMEMVSDHGSIILVELEGLTQSYFRSYECPCCGNKMQVRVVPK